jgi:hypothetical protein
MTTSRRQRILALTRELIEARREAVLCADIQSAAAARQDYNDLSASVIASTVSMLRTQGKLRVVGTRFGAGNKGGNLYLLTEMRDEDYAIPQLAPSWKAQVVDAFMVVWMRHLLSAGEGKVGPVLTREVRAELEQLPSPPSELADVRSVATAMQELAKRKTPVIEQVFLNEDTNTAAWCPSGFPQARIQVDSAYASDSERVTEAVRRLMPTCPDGAALEDVTDLLLRSPTLRLQGQSTVAKVLFDLTRPDLRSHGRERRPRAHVRLVRVSAGGHDNRYVYQP